MRRDTETTSLPSPYVNSILLKLMTVLEWLGPSYTSPSIAKPSGNVDPEINPNESVKLSENET